MDQVAQDLWIQRHPLKLMGTRAGRVVTVIRLPSQDVIVHSTAPFGTGDVAAIEKLGRVRWLVDVTLMHDTFSREGRAAFPQAAYLAPPGFAASGPTDPILPAPAAWSDSIDILELEGAPKSREHLMLHRPTGTLILADMVLTGSTSGRSGKKFSGDRFLELKIPPA